MVAGALKKVGVEAVVEGLGKFMGDVGKMNNSMASIGGQGNILTRTLGGVTNAFGYLADKIVDVATYALGQLLARAVEFVITQLAELVQETIAAGAEFQTMELRLKRLNFNDKMEELDDYADAMSAATQMTKDQLTWIQKLAVQTPYDATDIANVFTLARSYGFAAGEAQLLTKDISNFAAGMGLGNTEIERIIINFGQMVQQGKVTQRELNDLARGAFVPVNDILKRMQENIGLTGKEFDKFKTTGEGVNAFMTAFSQIVSERFEGAAEDLSRTFQGATDNAKDFVKSLIGFGVAKPILSAIGGKISDIISSLTAEERWDALTAAAGRVGEELAGLVEDILGLLPSTENLADGIVQGLDKFGDWITDHRQDIVNFFRGIGEAIQENVIPFVQRLVDAFNGIRDWLTTNRVSIEHFFKTVGNIINNTVVKFVTDKLIPAFQQISDWVGRNSALIQDFFLTLGTIIGDVFTNLTGVDVGGGLEGILGGVKGFMEWIVANQESVTEFVTGLTKLWAILQVVGFVFGIVLAIVTPLIAGFIGIVAAVAGVIAVLTVLLSPAGLIVAVFGLIVGAIVNFIIWMNVARKFGELTGKFLSAKFAEMKTAILARFTETSTGTIKVMESMKVTIIAKLFAMVTEFIAKIVELRSRIIDEFLGMVSEVAAQLEEMRNSALDIFEALVEGAVSFLESLYQSIVNVVGNMVSVFQNQNWWSIGAGIISSITQGILSSVANLIAAVVNAVQSALNAASAILTGGVPTPTVNLPTMTQQFAVNAPPTVSSTSNYTNNFSLTVHSSAPVEPLISDFQMLRSLAGG